MTNIKAQIPNECQMTNAKKRGQHQFKFALS